MFPELLSSISVLEATRGGIPQNPSEEVERSVRSLYSKYKYFPSTSEQRQESSMSHPLPHTVNAVLMPMPHLPCTRSSTKAHDEKPSKRSRLATKMPDIRNSRFAFGPLVERSHLLSARVIYSPRHAHATITFFGTSILLSIEPCLPLVGRERSSNRRK